MRRTWTSEAHAVDVRGEVLIPGLGRLLEPIQGLLQETNIVRFGGVDKAGWLLAVDSLLEVAVEEAFFTSSWWMG
jgi:hypothetical protein